MKAKGILLLGFAAAISGLALASEPAAAQCWSCGYGGMWVEDEGKWKICRICTGGDEGHIGCGTPKCSTCWNLGACSIQLSLDGRSAGPELPEAPVLGEPGDVGAFVAIFASAAHALVTPSNAPKTRRSCDGGIVSKWYSAGDILAARQTTAHLRL